MSNAGIAVVIGAGGIGEACADVLDATYEHLLIADRDLARAAVVAAALPGPATPYAVDIADRGSVRGLVEAAAAAGPIAAVVHTAGVSPTQAPIRTILDVDLLGTVHVLEEFGARISRGGAGVVIASMAGHLFASHLDPEQENALATGTPAELAVLPFLGDLTDRGTAYGIAKRGNHLRVRAATAAWGRRGARINSVSPGVVDTEMGRGEQDGPDAALVQMLIEMSPAGRAANPAEIAAAAAFLLGDAASFVTGTDLLVDGGACAAMVAPA